MIEITDPLEATIERAHKIGFIFNNLKKGDSRCVLQTLI